MEFGPRGRRHALAGLMIRPISQAWRRGFANNVCALRKCRSIDFLFGLLAHFLTLVSYFESHQRHFTTNSAIMAAVATLGQVASEFAAEIIEPQTYTQREEQINSINDFILHQARTIPDTPLLEYPGTELGAADFVAYTARQLDEFADEAAKNLARQGLKPSVSDERSFVHAPTNMPGSRQSPQRRRSWACWGLPISTTLFIFLPYRGWAFLSCFYQPVFQQRLLFRCLKRQRALRLWQLPSFCPPSQKYRTLAIPSEASILQTKPSGHKSRTFRQGSNVRQSSLTRKILSRSSCILQGVRVYPSPSIRHTGNASAIMQRARACVHLSRYLCFTTTGCQQCFAGSSADSGQPSTTQTCR